MITNVDVFSFAIIRWISAISRADWLSERMVIGDEDERTLSSWPNCFLASASRDASDNAIYSASIVE